jgi:uncharacterized protein (DUF362 family)
MTNAISDGVSGSAGNTRVLPAPAVTFLDCPDHHDLAGTLNRLRRSNPALLPTSLPRRVLIKPNLCDIVSWEAGVTTDPAWLGVLSDMLRAIRPDVEILVVESDAISAYKTYRSCDETFERLGYTDAARKAGTKLVNLTAEESIEIAMPGIPYPIRIAQLFLEEFYFISIANLKVHPYERMTAILKNSLGLLCDADISFLHAYLSALIAEFHLLCPPDLCIVDGRIGLEGHGPILGDPVATNTIIFSNDALTADSAACKLMQIPVEQVPHLGVVAKALQRSLPAIELPDGIQSRAFAFDAGGGHSSILLKFANRRLHKSSELFTNRWLDRFHRFKREPLKFAIEGIPKLVRRTYAR